MKRKISILGSTGSIGRQALEVIEKLNDKFEIIALTGGRNITLLNEQIKKFKPKYAYAENPKDNNIEDRVIAIFIPANLCIRWAPTIPTTTPIKPPTIDRRNDSIRN